MLYYVCDYETQKVKHGPYQRLKDATSFITTKPKSEQFTYCTMSRYMLAKKRIYPYNQAGDAALRQDLAK